MINYLLKIMQQKKLHDFFFTPPATHLSLVAIDANGNKLADGDTVTLIKDLKVKGAPKDLKQGTRVKNIRIVEGDHNIDCKIDGFGAMKLKSEFVKKI